MGGKREKKGKIMQHCAMFSNRKNVEAGANKYRVGTEIKGYGKQEV